MRLLQFHISQKPKRLKIIVHVFISFLTIFSLIIRLTWVHSLCYSRIWNKFNYAGCWSRYLSFDHIMSFTWRPLEKDEKNSIMWYFDQYQTPTRTEKAYMSWIEWQPTAYRYSLNREIWMKLRNFHENDLVFHRRT